MLTGYPLTYIGSSTSKKCQVKWVSTKANLTAAPAKTCQYCVKYIKEHIFEINIYFSYSLMRIRAKNYLDMCIFVDTGANYVIISELAKNALKF